jgi:hypothetical protein
MALGDRSKRGANRVVRGGSWNNNGRKVRSAIRNRNEPDNRNDNIGFRLSLAQRVVGMGAYDQIVIRSCGQLQAKSKAAGMSVIAWNGCERLPDGRFSAMNMDSSA